MVKNSYPMLASAWDMRDLRKNIFYKKKENEWLDDLIARGFDDESAVKVTHLHRQLDANPKLHLRYEMEKLREKGGDALVGLVRKLLDSDLVDVLSTKYETAHGSFMSAVRACPHSRMMRETAVQLNSLLLSEVQSYNASHTGAELEWPEKMQFSHLARLHYQVQNATAECGMGYGQR